MSRREARPAISVIVPIYNEERTLVELYRRLSVALRDEPGDYEILLVNDGSHDGSLRIMTELRRDDARVRVLSLSRNFGHQIAITAGLDHAGGDALVIIDGDLQDPPEVVPELLQKWREGFDVVYGVRAERAGESWFKKTTAMAFYRLFSRLTQLDVPLDTGDFRVLSRRAADRLRELREANRYVRGLTSWIGLRQTGVPYRRDQRYAGDTKFSLRKMIGLGLDGITSFSSAPLRISTYVGILIALGCVAYMAVALYQRVVSHTTVRGWASTMVVVLLLFAIQFIILGVYGEYIARIYTEVKRRPLYVLDEVEGDAQPWPREQGETARRAEP